MAPATQPHLQPPPASWSALPLDLAGLVLRLLPVYADRARFAAVCPQWRAAARQKIQPTALPLLTLHEGTFYSLPYDEPFRFLVCGSWLVFPRDDGCFLVNPFSRVTVTLPALSCVQLQPPNAVAKLSDEGEGKRPDPYCTWMHIKDSEKLHVIKLILCSSDLVAALVGVRYTSQILVCQPGASSWSVCATYRCKDYQDMAFYQGKLYALDDDENLLVVNISCDQSTGGPQVSRIARVIMDTGDRCFKGSTWYHSVFEDTSKPHVKPMKKPIWLNRVVCYSWYAGRFGAGFLLLKLERPEKSLLDRACSRYSEADFQHSRWIKVPTVGSDQILFLGRRCSRAVSVSLYGMLGNRIYFLDDDDEHRVDYFYDEENTSCSAYDMGLGDISSPHPLISWKRCHETHLAAWLFPQD